MSKPNLHHIPFGIEPALARSLGPDWSDDPSVLRARLSTYPPEELAALAPALITLEDEDIQKQTLKSLLSCNDTTTLAAVLRLAAEPRLAGVTDTILALQSKLSSNPPLLPI